MDSRGLSVTAAARQEAAFEAIKAKHRNILAYFTNQDNSLLLELADMILLLSAQLAQREVQKSLASHEDAAEGRPLHAPATSGDKNREYSDSLGFLEEV